MIQLLDRDVKSTLSKGVLFAVGRTGMAMEGEHDVKMMTNRRPALAATVMDCWELTLTK